MKNSLLKDKKEKLNRWNDVTCAKKETSILGKWYFLSSLHSQPTFQEDCYETRAESKIILEKKMYKKGQEGFEKEQEKKIFLLDIKMHCRI